MPKVRVPIISSVDPETSNGSVNLGSQSTNVIFDRYPDGKIYATQRPALQLSQDPANYEGLNSNGRGLYFWDTANTFVIVNDSSVEFGYGQNVGTISSGKDRVYFVETPDYLVILDPENNQGWTIPSSNPTTVVEITDADFPPNQSPSVGLAGGGVYLNGYLFVLGENGTVYNSNLNDPTAWTAIDFVNAQRETDGGIYLAKHHDNIVAIGSKSMEFFYDAGNPVGSPLNVRQDISYRTGCVDHKSIFVIGDIIIFIGSDRKGTNSLYTLKGFKLSKEAGFSIDRLLSSLGLERDYDFILSAALLDDHFLTFITAVDDDGSPGWIPIQGLVYDISSQYWTQFETDISGISFFSVIDVADKIFGVERNIELLLTDGNIFEISGSLLPIDERSSGEYFAEDYMVDNEDYVEDFGPGYESVNIPMTIITTEIDLDTDSYKFLYSLWIVGTILKNAVGTSNIDVSWTDDHYTTFTTARSISTADIRKLTRLGKFRRRAFKLEYSGPDTLRIESLELDTGVSQYA